MDFIRSTRCASSACIEAAEKDGLIQVRDSKNPDHVLTFTHAEWDTFTTSIRNGEYADL